jgi:hypothetical protein
MDNQNTKRWVIILLIIIIVLLCMAVGLLAYDYFGDSQGTEPTNVPATAIPTQTSPTEPLEPESPESQPTHEGPISIQTYSVDKGRIQVGECANISWQVDNADLIQLKRDEALVLDQAPAQHTYQACHDQAGIYVYRLEAKNGSGSENWMELQIIVEGDSGANSPIATLPPASGTVTINYFYVEPQRIKVGECATIFWEVLNADQVQLLRDEVVVVPYGQLEDSFTDCLNERAIYRYRLEAENSDGIYGVMELQVIVDP